MIVAKTHVANTMGTACVICGEPFPAMMYSPWQKVGVIKTNHGGTSIYAVGEHDSNEQCQKEASK